MAGAGGAPPTRKGWFFDRTNSRLDARYNNTTFLRATASAVTLPLATTISLATTLSTTLTVGTGLTVTSGGVQATGDNGLGGSKVTGARNTLTYAAAGTVVTAVGVGLHMPAVTYVDAGSTGTIAELNTVRVAAQTTQATNTITYTDAAGLKVLDPVASTGATFTRKYGIWTTGQIRTATNVQVGDNTALFGTTQPTQSVVFQQGTAPVGAIVTGGAIYTDGTVMKKIIAAGTVSNIET